MMSLRVKMPYNSNIKLFCSGNSVLNLLGVRKVITSFIKSASTEVVKNENEANELISAVEEPFEDEEAAIEMKRNKSRLAPQHRNMLFEKVPYDQPVAEHHDTVKYNRRLYGKYGADSGVYPGIMWPTKEDLQERKEYEQVAYPFTIQELIQNARQKIEDKEALIQARQQELLKKMKKVNQWKKELEAKTAKKLAEANAAKEKKERLIEEVRRHFGYKVNPKEDRFKEMLVQKEKEERKKAKQIKQKQREEMLLSQMLEKAKTDS